MEDDNKPEKKPTKGYGKRPAWQWILIYAVVAIIVYGLIYYFFIKDGSDSSGSLGY